MSDPTERGRRRARLAVGGGLLGAAVLTVLALLTAGGGGGGGGGPVVATVPGGVASTGQISWAGLSPAAEPSAADIGLVTPTTIP